MYCYFKPFHVNEELLTVPVSKCCSIQNYQCIVSVVRQPLVVNDSAERAFGVATKLHRPTMLKDENQLQTTQKIVNAKKMFQESASASSERELKQIWTKF